MTLSELNKFEKIFATKISEIATADDPAHDILHFKRVVANAKLIMAEERARPEIIVPAAWLHDFVIIPKNDPRRSQASRLSAQEACGFLRGIGYPENLLEETGHAIAAHSFSAAIEPGTLEAKVVQDADRLDGLGAIGIARCFATAGLLRRGFYRAEDPFCEDTSPDDAKYTIDHFYQKLFKTAETLCTPTAKKIGRARVQVMKEYLESLRGEISGLQ